MVGNKCIDINTLVLNFNCDNMEENIVSLIHTQWQQSCSHAVIFYVQVSQDNTHLKCSRLSLGCEGRPFPNLFTLYALSIPPSIDLLK